MYRTESDDVMQGTPRVLNALTDGLWGGVYTGRHCRLAMEDRLCPRPAMSSAEGQISTHVENSASLAAPCKERSREWP